MAVRVSFPNIKQPFTDSSGYITKAFYDFLRTLWERTGGSQDMVSEIEDNSGLNDTLVFRSQVEELKRRVDALEKQLTSLGC